VITKVKNTNLCIVKMNLALFD